MERENYELVKNSNKVPEKIVSGREKTNKIVRETGETNFLHVKKKIKKLQKLAFMGTCAFHGVGRGIKSVLQISLYFVSI